MTIITLYNSPLPRVDAMTLVQDKRESSVFGKGSQVKDDDIISIWTKAIHGSIGIDLSPMKTACSETLHGVPQYYGTGRKNARKKIRIVGSRQVQFTYQDDILHIFCQTIETF